MEKKPFTVKCFIDRHAAHIERFAERPVAERYALFCVGQFSNNYPDPATGRAPANATRQFTCIWIEDTATGRIVQEVYRKPPADAPNPTLLRLHLDEEAGR